MELVIILATVIVIFVVFEVLSSRKNRKLIEKYESHISEQDKYIKRLEKDYNELIERHIDKIENKLNGK